jgi:hypothetical protein
MKFTHAFNIWEVPSELLKHAQAGQWVYAGDKSNKGIFLGVKRSGTIVVAWYGNAKGQQSFKSYIKTLRTYAKG